MSRWNGFKWEVFRVVVEPFVWFGLLLFVGLPLALAYLCLAILYDQDTAEERINRWLGVERGETA